MLWLEHYQFIIVSHVFLTAPHAQHPPADWRRWYGDVTSAADTASPTASTATAAATAAAASAHAADVSSHNPLWRV